MPSKKYETLTIGQVVDTNDPQQMGRVRALCPVWGDNENDLLGDIPWATYISPFMGVSNAGFRSHRTFTHGGSSAYGFWSLPKVGAHVLVGCIDGDPSLRFWIGCMVPELLPHTMPHGRYLWNTQDQQNVPEGPVDSNEKPIQPLYQNITKQFSKQSSLVPGTPTNPRKNMEWRTRGTDTQVSAVTAEYIQTFAEIETSIPDHRVGNLQFTTITQENGEEFTVEGPGYSISQITPDSPSRLTGFNYDSQMHSWTTPGFHSISMDDRYWNSRMRLRTMAGNQVIMDDTNERIYVSTAEGKTWIELDRVGNVDIYADRNVSVHAGGDINYTTDQTFRIKAKDGIHMQTDGEFRTTSKQNTHMQTEGDYFITSKNTFVRTGTTLQISSKTFECLADDSMSIQSGGVLQFESGSSTSFKASSDFVVEGSTINLNGPPAPTLNLQSADEANEAFWTSRVPEHEPWARMFMTKKADQDSDNQWEPEYSYTDSMVGKGSQERGETYERNRFWRR